jgi:hypothetical protein
VAVERIDYVADWAARLRGRLYAQFRDDASWQQWCDEVLGPQFQDLEDSAQSLLKLYDIDASEGELLDLIGRVVGQRRLGTLDPVYRLYLKARVLANRSTGTPENIYDVLRALYGAATARPMYIGGWNKQFAVRVRAVIEREAALVGADLLRSAKESGARGILEWQESADADLYYLDSAHATLTTALVGFGAATTLDVTTTEGFPTSGATLVLDPGGAAQEVGGIAILGIISSTQLSISNGSLYDHPIGTVVQLVTSPIVVGKGLDLGLFAGAKQA